MSIYPWDKATLARMSRLLTLPHSFIFLCHTLTLTTFLFLGILSCFLFPLFPSPLILLLLLFYSGFRACYGVSRHV